MPATPFIALWTKIVTSLGRGPNPPEINWNWRERVVGLDQLSKATKRIDGILFSDADVFEALLKSVLSNSTDWSRVKRIEEELSDLFFGFSLDAYAQADSHYVDNKLIPRFRSVKAGSMTLAADLKRLTDAARLLSNHAKKSGSADHFFDCVIGEANGDLIHAVELLGTPASQYKIPGMGIPLAAETMKNLGYEVAKPDRHICRAVACWQLVSFRDKQWSARGDFGAPQSKPSELIETMQTIESLAIANSLTPSFVDQAIWLLCAKSGCHVTNEELSRMRS